MRLSHKHKFIFFSNPKTGSETVRKILNPYSEIKGIPLWEQSEDNPFYTHIRPVEVREIFRHRGRDYDSYYTFTFVRNPWARMVSLYEMIFGEHREHGPISWLPDRLRRLLGCHPSPGGFRRWLASIRPDGPGAGGPPNQRWRVYGAYSIENYAGDEKGNILVDDIVRLERINIELAPILDNIGLADAASDNIPKINTRDHPPYESYYDEESVEVVRQRYAYAIERFGYGFGD